jgi:hypothetical protein
VELPERPEVRIGDAERDAVVDSLKAHFGAGRLSLDEFEERTAQALSARTVGELVPLTADLPVPRPASVPARRPLPADPWARAYSVHVRVAALLAVLSVLIWIVSLGHLSPFWPLAVILGSVLVHWAVRRAAVH